MPASPPPPAPVQCWVIFFQPVDWPIGLVMSSAMPCTTLVLDTSVHSAYSALNLPAPSACDTALITFEVIGASPFLSHSLNLTGPALSVFSRRNQRALVREYQIRAGWWHASRSCGTSRWMWP